MKKSLLCHILLMFVLTYTGSAYALYYQYFWSANSRTQGGFNYQGLGGGGVSTTVGGFTYGLSTVSYVSCSTQSQAGVDRHRQDYYVLVPKIVMLGGTEAKVFVVSGDYSVDDSLSSEFYIVKKVGSVSTQYVSGACGQVGNTYNMTSSVPLVNLRLEIPSDIDVGGYNGIIGLKLSMAEYHYTGDDIHPFDDALALQYSTSTISVPYNLDIITSCEVTPSSIEFNHGDLPRSFASGNRKEQSVSLTCSKSASLKLSIRANNPPNHTYPLEQGVGVGLGGYWDSLLMLDDGNGKKGGSIPLSVVDNTQAIINVSSEIRGDGNSVVGDINGSAILLLSVN